MEGSIMFDRPIILNKHIIEPYILSVNFKEKKTIKFDFEKYFSAIATAEDIQNHKPAPDTFLRCAELIQAKPQRCLVFEDGDFGIQAGLRAGMDVFDVRVNKLIRGNS